MKGVGTRLEELGWHQGAIVKVENTHFLLSSVLENTHKSSTPLQSLLLCLKKMLSKEIDNSKLTTKCKPFLKCTDKSAFLADTNNIVLIVSSQSCDIANNSIDVAPFIELSLGRIIEKINGNLAFNKNPRTLHTELQYKTEDLGIRFKF